MTKARQWDLFAQRTGKRHPDLDAPQPHPAAEHLVTWWRELNGARRSGGMGGPDPIGYTELDAWARLTGRRPTSLEVRALRAMDEAFLGALAGIFAERRAAQAAKEKRT